ncbi:Ceramide synthase 4 [Mizuhopecten yessoensis]|uniref:Ceramide synthase 4 n=1 Tax=Mizuhopecten yessoensis TaxID=6573 RepID=A0A210PGZ8_MIZYE|nr:Ceramide synthase 4 [Mizuhopecten yessoensis]
MVPTQTQSRNARQDKKVQGMQKPYFLDSKYFWVDMGRQHVPNDVYWYYTIELAFYWNLVFTLVTDHKRKDFVEMVVHHIVTILLIYFSFACNQLRLGTMVLLVHDSVDFWMAGAKMALYLKKSKTADGLFGIFLLIWFYTRLYIYPFRIVWSGCVQSLQHTTIFPVYWLLNGLLCALQVLHIIWTYMILRMVVAKLTNNELKDVRSDTESSTCGEEDDIPKETEPIVNGSTNSLRKRPLSDDRGTIGARRPLSDDRGTIGAGRPLSDDRGTIGAGRPLSDDRGTIGAGRPLSDDRGTIGAGRPLSDDRGTIGAGRPLSDDRGTIGAGRPLSDDRGTIGAGLYMYEHNVYLEGNKGNNA